MYDSENEPYEPDEAGVPLSEGTLDYPEQHEEDPNAFTTKVNKPKSGNVEDLLRPIGVPEGEKVNVKLTYGPDNAAAGVPLSEGTPKPHDREYVAGFHAGVKTAQDEEAEYVGHHATPVAMSRDVEGRVVVVCADGGAYRLDFHDENGPTWEPLPPVPGSRIWEVLADE